MDLNTILASADRSIKKIGIILIALTLPRLHKIQDQHLKMAFIKNIRFLCLTSQAAFLNKLEEFSLLEDKDLINFMRYHADFK